MSKIDNDLIKYLKDFITKERFELFEEKIGERTRYITVVLENIFQSHNISASIRSSDCFGIQDVHVIENDNVFKDRNFGKLPSWLKKQGFDIWIMPTQFKLNKSRFRTLFEKFNKIRSKSKNSMNLVPSRKSQ